MLTAELPQALRAAAADLFPSGPIRPAAAALSARYRDRGVPAGPRARSAAEVAAYAATRLPATFAACTVALAEGRRLLPGLAPRTQLDLGAGLGAALWAAAGVWGSLERLTAVELEPAMLAAGRRLGGAGPASVSGCAWILGDAARELPQGPFDLVTAGYLLGELDAGVAELVVERAFALTTSAVVLIEPGTPDGYRRILSARRRLIELGGHVLAPCPHDLPCPLGHADWCHFGVRLPRSPSHRAAKGAELGHEDEKLSYVVVARDPVAPAPARILRRPRVRGGHVLLELCGRNGLERVVVSKSDGPRFREARKASWGHAYEPPP